MRRMKDTMLAGKRLIELPDKTIDLVKLDFTKEERDIYKMVRFHSRLYLKMLTNCCRLKPQVKQHSIDTFALGRCSSKFDFLGAFRTFVLTIF